MSKTILQTPIPMQIKIFTPTVNNRLEITESSSVFEREHVIERGNKKSDE